MVKELAYISYASVFTIFIASLFSNLYDIASETSEKTITFAEDMSSAIECATRGISIYECSPNLDPNSEYFKKQLEETNKLLNNTIENINELY